MYNSLVITLTETQTIFFMNATLIASLIALAGVLASLILAYITSRKTLNTELLKITTSVEQAYTIRIIEERSKRYPAVYEIIGSLAADIAAMEKGFKKLHAPITKKRLLQTMSDYNDLKDGHSIFYSIDTAYAFYAFSERLNELIHLLQSKDDVLPREYLDELRTKISLAEMGLKRDLGIPIEEFQPLRTRYSGKDYKDFKR